MAKSDEVIYVNTNTENVKSATEDLDKELLVLRLALGKLKAAIVQAVAPIGAVFVPALQKAVWAATRLVKSVGKVIAALFGYSSASKSTAKAQEKLAKANEKVKRSLMGFDEVNRLNGDSAGLEETMTLEETTLTPQLQAVVDKILSLVAPLNTIDFTSAIEAFGRLKEALAPISQTLFAGLEWAWFNLLVPLAKWTAEDFLPVFLDTLAALLKALNAVIVALQPAADWLWESFLKPLAEWTGEKIINALGWLRERLDSISLWVSENPELTQKIVLAAAAIAVVNGVLGEFNGILGGMPNPMGLVSGSVMALASLLLMLIANWDAVKSTAKSVWESIQTTWGPVGDWFQQNVLSPLSQGFKNMVNGVVGFLNGLVTGLATAVNGIVDAINKLSFTVPDWVPGIGGETFGFDLVPVTAPQIPYLAQGAVLPANKPFLAVVGDQKHGTNVEAPLATIQQAVAGVMGDQTTAILAGFATSVEVQREILQAVLGIQIGDDVIGGAMSRYQQKMAVVNGGFA